MIVGFSMLLATGKAQLPDYGKYPVYQGHDLGVTYSTRQSTFKLWAPSAQLVRLQLINNDTRVPIRSHDMKKDKDGTWVITLPGDLKGIWYVYRTMIDSAWQDSATDPYARAVSVNGQRGVVVDLKETNPVGWEKDKSPKFVHKTDAIIYELHVRDASIAFNSGIQQKGKFLGLTEKETRNSKGLSTGLDHIRELGVTHVHLLPFYDFNSIDETKPNSKYNWGYDPLNYNVPEGSYSTDPFDAMSRIREFKQLVKTFHDNGLRVVMDVVYNHTALTGNSNFNLLVPGYYYRHTPDGKFSNATACGNETASERPMMRKFILESMKYWVEEYHIDGFRIDLMGVHDIETMNLVSRELHKIRPDILLYGEGWTAGASPLPDSLRALKANAAQLDRIAVFSDDIRDGIRGHVFTPTDKGFASGKAGMEESIKFGVVASLPHPQVDYSKVNYSKAPYAEQPHQTVTYVECHDNHVLWDKLGLSATSANESQRKEMHKLALSIVLTSQGISFIHAGTEFLRSKKGVENSFESPDSINAIDWDLKTRNRDVNEMVRSLIKIRKEHPAFRMRNAKDIEKNISFINNTKPGLIGFKINGGAVHDKWKHIWVLYNGSSESHVIPFPVKDLKKGFDSSQGSGINAAATISPYSCVIYYE